MSRQRGRSLRAEGRIQTPRPDGVVIVEQGRLGAVPLGERAKLYDDLAEHQWKVHGLPSVAQFILLPEKCPDAESWARTVERELGPYEGYVQTCARERAAQPPEPNCPTGTADPVPRLLSEQDIEEIHDNMLPREDEQ